MQIFGHFFAKIECKRYILSSKRVFLHYFVACSSRERRELKTLLLEHQRLRNPVFLVRQQVSQRHFVDVSVCHM